MVEKSIMGFFIVRWNMEQLARLTQFRGFRKIRKNAVKLTALLYLREALLEERYEECAGFIDVASEFGAQPFEIQNILEDPRRVPQA